MINLLAMLEILEDQKDLKEVGLSREEIEAYLEFFIENFELKELSDVH